MNGYHNGNGNGYQIDKEGLEKVGEPNDELEDHETLTRTIKDIDRVDPRRAKEVYYFFNGYFNAVKNVVENLNENGKICLVVGNRTVKGYQIPMDQITASFLDNMGLNFKGILVRGYP